MEEGGDCYDMSMTFIASLYASAALLKLYTWTSVA
jgi:hypothetical protein